jgi:predicted nucleic acid-binding protein
MKKRLYIESSVWNQLTHNDKPEWQKTTLDFISTLEKEIYEIFVSDLVFEEIERTPDIAIRETLLNHILKAKPNVLEFGEEAQLLVEKYKEAQIIKSLKRRVLIDMGHVAIATVNNVRHIISFNFEHLVKERNIDAFNGINLQNGYDVMIDIKTPHSFIDL